MASPTKLGHVVLKTYDVERMRTWYCLALDGRVVFEQLPEACFFTYDDEHHRLAFVRIPSEPVIGDWPGPGIVHISFTFGDFNALMTQIDRLDKAGHAPGFVINHGPTFACYYHDPDGHTVELQIDRMSLEDGLTFMGSATFANNPLGIRLDSNDLLKRWRGGESEESMLHYDETIAVDVPLLHQQMSEFVGLV